MSVNIGVIGPGLVGSAFITQVQGQLERLRQLLGATVKIVGLANSKRQVYISDGISHDDAWKAQLQVLSYHYRSMKS